MKKTLSTVFQDALFMRSLFSVLCMISNIQDQNQLAAQVMGVLSKDKTDSILLAGQSQSEGSNSLYLEYLIIYHFQTQVVLNPHSSDLSTSKCWDFMHVGCHVQLGLFISCSYVVIFFYVFSKENIINSPALGQLLLVGYLRQIEVDQFSIVEYMDFL